MTGQSLLDMMELVNQELQLQTGEADVTRGLLALNVAQDYFETYAAVRKIKGGQTGTLSTAQNTESTAFPTGVLRIDRLQLLDAGTGRPKYDLTPLHRVGGHLARGFWPLNITSTTTSGEPRSYWTNGANIFWSPLPSGTFSVRWYGFQRQVDITASGTFSYDDLVALPLASFAARLMKMSVDDSVQEINSLAQETFKAALDSLEMFNRDGAAALEYSEIHTE